MTTTGTANVLDEATLVAYHDFEDAVANISGVFNDVSTNAIHAQGDVLDMVLFFSTTLHRLIFNHLNN
ncbi:unnamed protein product [Adineta ricciae]|uniref:Uncharacterized protein n=1 Tax=Adineta ricciae TaxID=249248 RepID=A0A815QSN3_ADIRI|nr:unnamed protein product [Adineta ricciae]